jgi:hypothetical protein
VRARRTASSRRRAISSSLYSLSVRCFRVCVMIKTKFPLDPTTDPWASHFHAIGAIAVAWNDLEQWMHRILEKLTRFDREAAGYLTSMLGNVSISGLVKRVARSTDGRPEILDLLDHLVEGFEICRENRNTVLHSRLVMELTGGPTAGLAKRAKLGGYNRFSGNITDLVRVAAETNTFGEFAFDVYIEVLRHPTVIREGLAHLLMTYKDEPLPSKPPLPNKLNPNPPAGVQKAVPRQRQPSRSIRKAQRKKLWKKPE